MTKQRDCFITTGGNESVKKCKKISILENDPTETSTSELVDSVDGRNLIPDLYTQRLVVVTNRLPFSATRVSNNTWSLKPSSGGLVSALSGIDVPDDAGQKSLVKAIGEEVSKESTTLSLHSCIPVFLSKDVVDKYYNGFCNRILWSILHHLGTPEEDPFSKTGGFHQQFDAYKTANKIFADTVMSDFEKRNVFWIHDYHLMMVPQYLKQCTSLVKVGWFLHTPFPSAEFYRNLPSRTELLEAVRASDFMGFQTDDYAIHFITACVQILMIKKADSEIDNFLKLLQNQVSTFPIGIDCQLFVQHINELKVEGKVTAMRNRFPRRKVILGVDRLDIIKGIPKKLLAFEKYLDDNPEMRGQVLLLQIAIPSRTEVPEYQILANKVHEIVGRINGKHGTLGFLPVHHLDQSVSFDDLCCLYAMTDVALVTSIRDGMNLVSYEFVACQDPKRGVLILSEFAGAADLLRGCITVNPWDIDAVAVAIKDALTMTEDEIESRHRENFSHVKSFTAQTWADDFVSTLLRQEN